MANGAYAWRRGQYQDVQRLVYRVRWFHSLDEENDSKLAVKIETSNKIQFRSVCICIRLGGGIALVD